MGYVQAFRVNPDDLDTCDICNQQGYKRTGHMTYDRYGEPLIFICFNCKERVLKGKP